MIYKSKGIISIFLALIILPVYSFAILTIDVVKIAASQTHLQIANEKALNSALSLYNRDLYKKFNIFGINYNNDYLSAYINDILIENIENDKSKFYNSQINSITLNLRESDYILNNSNLEKQIVDYMKLKGPYMLSKGVLNLIDITKNTKTFNHVLDKKLDYEEEYSKVNENLDDLVKYMKQYDEKFGKINNEFFQINKNLENFKRELSSKFKLTNRQKFKEKFDKLENSKKSEIKNLIKKYNSSNSKLRSDISVLNVIYNEMISSLKILSSSSDVLQSKLNIWGESIKNMEKSEVKNNFNSDFKSTKFGFTKENIDKLLKKLLDTKSTFDQMITLLDPSNKVYKIDISKLSDINLGNFDVKNIKKLPSLRNFKLYKFAINNSKSKENSGKKSKAKSSKKELENFGKNLNQVGKSRTNNSLLDFINVENKNKIIDFSASNDFNIKNKNSISNYKNILNNISNLFPSNMSKSLENILISQYIVQKFSHKLQNKEEFNNQIEYILFGNDSLSKNESNVNNYIFGIRFILNSIYAYTNSDLINEANIAAVAISGFTGFGVPLVRSLILASMSFGESIIDLETLNSDNSLEAFKNKSNWSVSIKGLPKLLGNNIKDISNSAIDNIYETISDYTDDKIDKLNKNMDEFINQTIDGVSQSIISEILSPIQMAIFNSINLENEEFQSNINDIISNIENEINTDNSTIKKLKIEILNYVKDEMNSIVDKINEISIDKYFEKITKNIESKIINFTSKYSSELKNKINTTLDKNKIEQKEKVNNYIDAYINKLGYEGEIKTKGSTSGMSFKYKDYLILLGFIRLSSGDRENIIRRIGLLIDYEIKKINPEFDITNLIVNISFDTKIIVNTWLLKKYILIDDIKRDISGGY
ncbi:DUF5702 domain-containing protein [Helcococcus bovis]|uniref:DUF5702 domain-containing protein n=1 Tax=Helcococcus bovis TaxID=3153252 RepID=UPI0038BBBB12